jgi:hypothetical protein
LLVAPAAPAAACLRLFGRKKHDVPDGRPLLVRDLGGSVRVDVVRDARANESSREHDGQMQSGGCREQFQYGELPLRQLRRGRCAYKDVQHAGLAGKGGAASTVLRQAGSIIPAAVTGQMTWGNSLGVSQKPARPRQAGRVGEKPGRPAPD